MEQEDSVTLVSDSVAWQTNVDVNNVVAVFPLREVPSMVITLKLLVVLIGLNVLGKILFWQLSCVWPAASGGQMPTKAP